MKNENITIKSENVATSRSFLFCGICSFGFQTFAKFANTELDFSPYASKFSAFRIINVEIENQKPRFLFIFYFCNYKAKAISH